MDRAGTFIYHSHSNELHQIAGGLYGAMLVVDPDTWRPQRERVVVIGGDGYFSDVARINGMRAPDPIEVPADEPIRLRIVNIQVDFGLTVQMLRDTVPVSWTPVAKDGAELPAERKVATSEHWLTVPGETADFEVTLPRGEYRLMVRQYFGDFEIPLVVRSVP
jgi:FtsP/CotA-like multicopper oxidase with cupredoxin domain